MAYPNNYNICIFCGRLVKDPEIKTYNSANGGFSKALFTLAVDRNLSAAQKQEAQNKGEPTADFVDFSTSNPKDIENLQKYYTKGKPMMVQAVYRKWSYKDQQSGQTKYAHAFEVVNMAFAIRDSSSGNNGGNDNSGYQNNQPQYPPMNPPNTPQATSQPQNNFNLFDDNEVF